MGGVNDVGGPTGIVDQSECALIKYYELTGTPGVAVQEWLDTAVEGTANSVTVSDLFSGTDSEGLPAHPNAPDSIRVNPDFNVTTNQVGSSHQSIYEARVYFEKAGYIRDIDSTSEKGMVYMSTNCCGSLSQKGNEWVESPLPRSRQQTNPVFPVSAGLHRIRVYLHDRAGTNSGFDLEFSEDQTTWVKSPVNFTGKPTRECKLGTYCKCSGKYYDDQKQEIKLGATIKLCKPDCQDCGSGSGADVEVPEDKLDTQLDSTTFPPNPEDNDTMVVTDDGTETGNVTEYWKYDEESDTWINIMTSCPGPMTRAQLIALRNAGGLDIQCHYVITDPNPNGTLGATLVLMHALDANTLSGCYVKTPHDNIAWDCRYDIDTNRFEFVADNLNNEITDNLAITVFPRGNNSVYDNRIRGASVLTYDGGTVYGNTIGGQSNVRVRGVNFINNIVETDATVDSNANTQRNRFEAQSNTTISAGDFRENKVEGDATVVSSTTGDVDNNIFSHSSNSTISGTSNLDNSTIGKDGNLSLTGGNVDNVTVLAEGNLTHIGGNFADSTVGQDAQVTLRSGSNYENYFGDSVIYNQVGTGYVRYSTIKGTTTWTNGNTNVSNVDSHTSTVNTTNSAGSIFNSHLNRAYLGALQNIPSLTITDSSVTDYATVSTNGASRIYLYRSNFSGGFRVLVSAGARLDSSYTDGDSYGYIQTTQAFLRTNYCTVSSLGYIRNLTPNTNYVERSHVSSSASLRFDGTTNNCRIYYSSASGGASIYHTGTSNASYIYYSSADGLGQIYTSNSPNARFYYNHADSRGYLRSLNATTTHYMYYCNASASGYIQFNGSRGRLYACEATSQSILEKRGNNNSNIYYSTVSAYFYAYITLTAGTKSGLFGMGRRTQTLTNPTNVAPFAIGSARMNFS